MQGSLVSVSRVSGVAKRFSPVVRVLCGSRRVPRGDPSAVGFVANPVVTSQSINNFLQVSEQRHVGPAKQSCIVRELELQLLCKTGLFRNENDIESLFPPSPHPSQICPLARQSYPYPCPRDENGASECAKDCGWGREGQQSTQQTARQVPSHPAPENYPRHSLILG